MVAERLNVLSAVICKTAGLYEEWKGGGVEEVIAWWDVTGLLHGKLDHWWLAGWK